MPCAGDDGCRLKPRWLEADYPKSRPAEARKASALPIYSLGDGKDRKFLPSVIKVSRVDAIAETTRNIAQGPVFKKFGQSPNPTSESGRFRSVVSTKHPESVD